MSHKRSKTLSDAINRMYAEMARAAGKKAVKLAGEDDNLGKDYRQEQAQLIAARAEAWADKAGANALRWGLV